MAASDLTSVAYIVKRLYTDDATADVAQRKHALFSRVPKRGGFTGSAYFYPIRYGNPQGVGGRFSDVQGAASSSKGVQLQASRKTKYGVITLNGEAIAACDGNKGSFLELVQQEFDGVLEEMGDSLAFDLYRDGTGARGRRSSINSNTVTLTVADDARNFKVGMTVKAGTLSGTTWTLRNGSTTVSSVDEDAGTVTLASAAAITSFADNDYLLRIGDDAGCMEGLESLTPLTAPSASESFRGIDRSVHTRLLAGVRVDATTNTIEENIGTIAVRISQNGQKANEVYLNPIKFWEIVRRRDAKVEYTGGGDTATYGFESIKIATPAGVLNCIADADCPTNRIRVVNNEEHYLKHLRGLPHIIMDDGLRSLRSTSADDIEARARAWVNYCQRNPAAFGVGSI